MISQLQRVSCSRRERAAPGARVPPQANRRLITDPAATTAPGLAPSTPTAGDVTIAELSGELDIACAQRCASSFSACSAPAPADSSSTCPR
jgi:hypothetical protein